MKDYTIPFEIKVGTAYGLNAGGTEINGIAVKVARMLEKLLREFRIMYDPELDVELYHTTNDSKFSYKYLLVMNNWESFHGRSGQTLSLIFQAFSLILEYSLHQNNDTPEPNWVANKVFGLFNKDDCRKPYGSQLLDVEAIVKDFYSYWSSRSGNYKIDVTHRKKIIDESFANDSNEVQEDLGFGSKKPPASLQEEPKVGKIVLTPRNNHHTHQKLLINKVSLNVGVPWEFCEGKRIIKIILPDWYVMDVRRCVDKYFGLIYDIKVELKEVKPNIYKAVELTRIAT